MHFSYLLPLAAVPFSLAKTIDISVGNGALAFSPNNVPASVGDILAFRFYPQNHSVAQSNFAAPCLPLAGGSAPAIFSGFVPEPASGPTTFSVTVNATTPLWFYCSQVEHCKGGMSMVVNEPSNATLATYQAAAAKTNSTSSPAAIAGGVLSKTSATNSSNATTTATGSASGSGASSTGAGNTVPSPTLFKGGAEKVGMMGVTGVVGLALVGLFMV